MTDTRLFVLGGGPPRKFKRFVHPLFLKLRKRRIFLGISGTALGEVVGCNKWSIWEWERGDYTPQFRNLIAWCNALDYELTMTRIRDWHEGGCDGQGD